MPTACPEEHEQQLLTFYGILMFSKAASGVCLTVVGAALRKSGCKQHHHQLLDRALCEISGEPMQLLSKEQ